MFLLRKRCAVATISVASFARTTCSNEENTSSIDQAIYNLKHVIVITRHGDRSPISKSIGPNFPHNSEVDDLWRSKIVSGVNEELLKGVAKSQSNNADDNIYTGRDVADIPYGQLTDVGANQLKLLGSNLREKYVIRNKFLPEVLTGDVIYTRSTNMCRTMNSLRSLLIGLYGVRNVQDIEELSFPQIRSYPAHHDPMIDGVTTNADEKDKHRKVLFEQHSLPHGFIDFKVVNEKLKRCLGYPNRVNYHVIREHLVCNRSHNLDLPGGLADEDITQQYELELWVARILFGDRKYNSHEIGSFMAELRDRLSVIQSGDAKERLSIYSAHDYTLLPLMIGLDILQDGFPHYGSNLRMEIATRNSGSRSTPASSPSPPSPASSSAESLYVRLLWNDTEISFPGFEAWCPLEVVVQKLHAGSLGVQDSTAPGAGVEAGPGGEEDLSATLNALDDLDSVLNEALAEGGSEADER